MSVLLTHARHRATLAATRSLGKAGIDVITSDSISYATSFFSKYSKSHFVYPSPKSKPESFIRCMRHRIQKGDIDVFMPMGEESHIISKYIKMFDNATKVPIPAYEKILKANNKRYLMNFAKEIGVKTPQTYTIDDLADLKKVAKKVEFPAVIKPVIGFGAQGIRYVYSENELIMEYKKVMQKFNFSEYPLIQEYIPGNGYGVSMLFNQGEPRAIFTHKRIREYPITGGPSTARVSVRHPKMEKYATKLLRELEWHGVAMVEFKLDDRTNEPVLMEINPRFWGSLYQAICAGVDFPYLLYTMALEGDVQPVFTYKIGVKTRWMLGDCRGLVSYLKTKKRMEILKDFFKFNDQYYDDISFDDPFPTIIEFMLPIMNFIKKGRLKFSPEEER